MSTPNKFTLLISGLFLLMSCKQSLNHDEAIKYFAAVSTEMKYASTTINDFWHQALEETKNAKQREDSKGDSATVNKLYEQLESSTRGLNSSIEKLSTVKEIDSNIALKEKVLSLLKNTKDLQISAMPILLGLLRNGFINMKESDKEQLKKFYDRAAVLREDGSSIDKAFEDFQQQNNISNEELKAYGLTEE